MRKSYRALYDFASYCKSKKKKQISKFISYGSVDIVCGPLFLNGNMKEIESDSCRIRVP